MSACVPTHVGDANLHHIRDANPSSVCRHPQLLSYLRCDGYRNGLFLSLISLYCLRSLSFLRSVRAIFLPWSTGRLRCNGRAWMAESIRNGMETPTHTVGDANSNNLPFQTT